MHKIIVYAGLISVLTCTNTLSKSKLVVINMEKINTKRKIDKNEKPALIFDFIIFE